MTVSNELPDVRRAIRDLMSEHALMGRHVTEPYHLLIQRVLELDTTAVVSEFAAVIDLLLDHLADAHQTDKLVVWAAVEEQLALADIVIANQEADDPEGGVQ